MLFQTEVIVNSVASNLDLNNGAISSAIYETAGPTIQQELTKNYPNGIKGGQLVSSSGGKMAWKKIYHSHLCNWDNGKGKAEMVNFECVLDWWL